MEIKVGEKIRCNDGLIGELIRIERDDIDISLKWYVFDDGKNERYVNKPYITKHSFSLTDLIEVGDYVNGHKVVNEIYGEDDNNLYFEIEGGFNKAKYIAEKDIKTILTREQFEANAYKVKGEW